MATTDTIHSHHDHIRALTYGAAAAHVLSLSAYFMSHEMDSFDRVSLGENSAHSMNRSYKTQQTRAKVVGRVAGGLYIISLVILILSLFLYRDEREQVATNITGIVVQVKTAEGDSDANEAGWLGLISASILLAGASVSAREFAKSETFGVVGSTLMGLGWTGIAFSAGADRKALDSLNGKRLRYTLPGAAAIYMGTLMIPWQMKHHFVAGPAMALLAFGFGIFSEGNARALVAPTGE